MGDHNVPSFCLFNAHLTSHAPPEWILVDEASSTLRKSGLPDCQLETRNINILANKHAVFHSINHLSLSCL